MSLEDDFVLAAAAYQMLGWRGLRGTIRSGSSAGMLRAGVM